MADVKGRAFSATGKAILAGGYLVLDAKYNAFVIALSARMHALSHIEEVENCKGIYTIVVYSPQFYQGKWEYKLNLNDLVESGINYKMKEVNGKVNPFVEATVLMTMLYGIGAKAINSNSTSKNITITMYSDAEYHSQDNSRAKKSQDSSRTFLFHDKEITQVNKTGLGSSAGLVTSLTASLLSCHFQSFDVATWKTIVHNLAQISHCKAQGKIGSGFDVASATFGSIIYQRFDPKLINEYLEIKIAEESIEKLIHLVNEENWQMKHDNVTLPPGLRLLMGDVKGGSETPKLVSKVQKWRNENPEHSLEVWTNLNENNMKLVECLQNLESIHSTDAARYQLLIQEIENCSGDELLQSQYVELREIAASIRNIRKNLKIMTIETGAEIEPDQQTKLLDDSSSIKGVIGGVVPGAGGHDAICLLVSSNATKAIIETTTRDERFANVRWMDLKEQTVGLTEENFQEFYGL